MAFPKSDSAAILARIREALRLSAPAPSVEAPPDAQSRRRWLPQVGPDDEEQLATFSSQTSVLKAGFFRFPSLAAAREQLAAWAREEQWDRIATHAHPLTDGLLDGTEIPRFQVASGYDKQELEKCPVGLTACEALVAQTGSVLVSAASSGGRALSILPPHHIVVATRDQLVPDLTAAFARLRAAYGARLPGFLSFITGPSRTGDIERILVLGAHGPKRLSIFLID